MSTTITIGQSGYIGCDNSTLQNAVDAVSRAGGGSVEIPSGTYTLKDALQLRSGVAVVGESGTLLRRSQSQRGRLTQLIGFGQREFVVDTPQNFAVGCGVLLFDDNAFGFYTTAATIIGQDGNTFFLDRPLAHDYNPAANGTVLSLFPMISGIGIENVSVSGITLDGAPHETTLMNGCRGAGIFLMDAHRTSVQNVEVANYNGDGISFQQCTDIAVLDCHVHDNQGGGLHPGSGTVRYSLRGNRIERNGGCGIFYCLRTTHSICENNVISENGRDGISVGERDTDHILRGNKISGNGGAGIHLREPLRQSGDRLWIEDNHLNGNCRKDGLAEVFIANGLHDIAVVGNHIQTHGTPALIVGPDCENIAVVYNDANGRPLNEAAITTASPLTYQSPGNFPAVGPAAAATTAAHHLGVFALVPLPL